jgi:hypothetical protein
MNVTFERQRVVSLLRALKKSENSSDAVLRLAAANDRLFIQCEHGQGSIDAMVIEPGAFSTKLVAFDRLLRSYIGAQMLTLQADPRRFRIGGFSANASDYDPAPTIPE